MRIAAWFVLGCLSALTQDGAEVFRNHCSTCHRAGSSTSAPLPEALRGLPPQTILAALETGKMRSQGSLLSPAEHNLVANHVGRGERAQPMPASRILRGQRRRAEERCRVERMGRRCSKQPLSEIRRLNA